VRTLAEDEMKTITVFLAVLLLQLGLYAQAPKHHVVMAVTTTLSDGWALALTDCDALISSFGDGNVEIEVVAYGPGISMMHRGNTDFSARMQMLSRRGVTFAAGESTLRLSRAQGNEFLPFVKLVDSGPAEIVRRQEAGWSYLKGGF
jgi:intracellular sulfur oxidation DsrE/DsrF family protein